MQFQSIYSFTLLPANLARTSASTLIALVAVAVKIAITTTPIKIQRTPNTRPRMNLGVLSP